MFLKIRDWVPKKLIDIHLLTANPMVVYFMEEDALVKIYDNGWMSENPNAIHILEKHPEKINWYGLSDNPNAISILEANPDKIKWDSLSGNPGAIHLLEANPDKINWGYLSGNPAAIHLLEANPDKIDWNELSMNPAAIHLLEANPDKIHWGYLSMNPAAIHLLEANPDKANWLSVFGMPEAMHVIESKIAEYDEYRKTHPAYDPDDEYYYDEADGFDINWYDLSGNPAAIHILETHQDDVNLDAFTRNPAIFTYDYELIRNTNKEKNACVAQWFCRPKFIQKYIEEYGMEALDEYMT